MQCLGNMDSWNDNGQQLHDDWALGNSQHLQNQNSQNMLSNLSKNLISYENSYKKQLKNIKNLPQSLQNIRNSPQSCENIMRRKIKRKRIHFAYHQNEQQKHLQSNLIKNQNNQNIENIHTNQPNAYQQSNMSKLKKMFEIFNEVNTLNDSILPFKVNLNKISQKRILANIIFKDFNQNKQNHSPQNSTNHSQPATINIQNLQLKKHTIENNDFISIKNRVYSLNFKHQNNLLKNKKSQSQKFIMNNIFTNQRQNHTGIQRRAASFSKKKRTFSFRKYQHQYNQKTIEDIYENHKKQKNQNVNNQREKNMKSEMGLNEKFSDSRFFHRRQVLYELKSKGRNMRR